MAACRRLDDAVRALLASGSGAPLRYVVAIVGSRYRRGGLAGV